MRMINAFGNQQTIVFMNYRDGVERVDLLPFRREATGENLCAGQRQEPDARLVSGFVAEPPGGGTGTCAPFPRDVLHAIT